MQQPTAQVELRLVGVTSNLDTLPRMDYLLVHESDSIHRLLEDLFFGSKIGSVQGVTLISISIRVTKLYNSVAGQKG